MKLPSLLTYDELDGEEIKEVLRQRFDQLLSTVPYLQRHITLPRVRMTLSVLLETNADQPTPERLVIDDQCTVELHAVVDSSRDGKPAGQIRDEHDIPTPTPMRGDRDIGAHVVIENHPVLDGRVVTNAAGLEIDRTGTGGVTGAGMAKMQNATVVNMDQGLAGLRSGGERAPLGIFKNERK